MKWQTATKPGQYRSYEYGFQPVPDKYLAAFADNLGVSINALPPNYSDVLNWQMSKMMEYYRNMNDNHRDLIKNLVQSMEKAGIRIDLDTLKKVWVRKEWQHFPIFNYTAARSSMFIFFLCIFKSAAGRKFQTCG